MLNLESGLRMQGNHWSNLNSNLENNQSEAGIPRLISKQCFMTSDLDINNNKQSKIFIQKHYNNSQFSIEHFQNQFQ